MKASFWKRNKSFTTGGCGPTEAPPAGTSQSTSGFSSFLGQGGGGGDKGGVAEEGMVTTAFCSAPLPGLTVCYREKNRGVKDKAPPCGYAASTQEPFI